MTEASRLADLLRPTIRSETVLAAIAALPRDRFVPERSRARAYENVALPIGSGQTISQPLVVARMLEVLELSGGERVLDVGTGSGYHAALLALLADEVWTIERHRELSTEAARAIRGLGIENVHFVVGDGSLGLRQRAPFDAINVAAAAGAGIPRELEDQLAAGGRLVAPLGVDEQRLTLIRRGGEGLEATALEPVRFVPLIVPE
jgi:protein-L-isoaspartate(D-aspartate) O-methyltransferase